MILMINRRKILQAIVCLPAAGGAVAVAKVEEVPIKAKPVEHDINVPCTECPACMAIYDGDFPADLPYPTIVAERE